MGGEMVQAGNVDKGMVLLLQDKACKVVQDVEIERSLVTSKRGKRDTNVVITVEDVLSGAKQQSTFNSSTPLHSLIPSRYTVLDVSGDAFLSLMGEDDGENREDLKVPEGQVGSTLCSEFEEGNEVIVLVFKVPVDGSTREVITDLELPDAEADMRTAILASQEAAAASRLAAENDPRVLARALCVAVATGNLPEVVRLVEGGIVDISAKASGQGLAPLHLALYEGHDKIAELLVRHNANVTDQTADGATPLHLAVDKANPDLVELILGLPGVLVNAPDHQGWAPIHLAANNGRPRVIQLLLKAGCDMNARTHGGWNALHAAANNDHPLICLQLLLSGVDPDAVNYDEKLTPQGQAVRAKRHAAARALAYPLHFAAESGKPLLVKALLSMGLSLDSQDVASKRASECASTDAVRKIFKTPELHTEMGEVLAMIDRADVADCFFQLNYKSK